MVPILAVLGFSCREAQPFRDAETRALEAAFDKEANESTYNQLIEKYLKLIGAMKTNDKRLEDLLERALAASIKMKNEKHELIFLNNLVKNFYKRSDTPDHIVKMISLLRKFDKNAAADVMIMCFAQAFPNHSSAAEFQKNLPGVPIEEYILNIGKSIFTDTIKGFNEDNAYKYVDACEAYALILPDDPATAEYLFKAAETSKILRTYDKSFSIFDWIIERYPSHPRAESAAFMKPFIFDSELRDTANARKYYLEFIQKYPKSDFVDDAQYLISNLGKSEEQILEELKAKAKSNQ